MGHNKKYSESKIYNANGDVSKRWYVYYSFRNPATDKLERQTPIYAGVNLYKNAKERKKAIVILCKAIDDILENGYNPFIETTIYTEESKNYTIVEAVDFVMEHKKQTLRESSFVDFRGRINLFKKWLLENGFENQNLDSIKFFKHTTRHKPFTTGGPNIQKG
jgi:hypothetical protein